MNVLEGEACEKKKHVLLVLMQTRNI